MPNTHQPHSSLIDHLKELPDLRVNRTRHHELTDILVISICTPKKRGIKGKQLNASWDHSYLLRLLNF